MSSAYFASLVLLPTIITEPGQYRTRDGEVVTIYVASVAHDHGCIGAYPNRIPQGWHKSGRLYATSECPNDIVGRV